MGRWTKAWELIGRAGIVPEGAGRSGSKAEKAAAHGAERTEPQGVDQFIAGQQAPATQKASTVPSAQAQTSAPKSDAPVTHHADDNSITPSDEDRKRIMRDPKDRRANRTPEEQALRDRLAAQLKRERAAARAQPQYGSMPSGTMSVKEHLSGLATDLNAEKALNLQSYAGKIKDLETQLRAEGRIVTRRRGTHDISHKEGREDLETKSIEKLISDGKKPVTEGEFARYAEGKRKLLQDEYTNNIKRKNGEIPTNPHAPNHSDPTMSPPAVVPGNGPRVRSNIAVVVDGASRAAAAFSRVNPFAGRLLTPNWRPLNIDNRLAGTFVAATIGLGVMPAVEGYNAGAGNLQPTGGYGTRYASAFANKFLEPFGDEKASFVSDIYASAFQWGADKATFKSQVSYLAMNAQDESLRGSFASISAGIGETTAKATQQITAQPLQEAATAAAAASQAQADRDRAAQDSYSKSLDLRF